MRLEHNFRPCGTRILHYSLAFFRSFSGFLNGVNVLRGREVVGMVLVRKVMWVGDLYLFMGGVDNSARAKRVIRRAAIMDQW